MSLNRNAFLKRWYVDQLMKMQPETHKTYPYISLWDKRLAFSNSVFELISWNVTTVGHENWL